MELPDFPKEKPASDEPQLIDLDPVDRSGLDENKKFSSSLASYRKNPPDPYVTYALIGFLIFIFLLEIFAANGTPFLNPTDLTLIPFGGQSPNLILFHGQWWRLVTSTFLHGGPVHLLGNLLGLYIAGICVEEMFGGAWFFALYSLSGICGSLVSLYLGGTNDYSIGASGGILGVVGAALVVGSKWGEGRFRKWIYGWLAYPAYVSLTPHRGVDISAHWGGFFCGMMLAYFLFKTWKPGAPLPSFQSLAKVLAVACLGLQVWALSHPLLNYQKNHELAQQVWPGEEWMTDEEIEVHTGEWLRKYPHDPLLLYYKALAFEQKSNYREALRGFQKAASEKEMFDFYYGGMNTGLHFPDFFNCNFENVIQSQLAICLKRAGEKKEAKEVVRELRPRMWAADNKDIWSKLNEEGLGDDPEFYEGL